MTQEIIYATINFICWYAVCSMITVSLILAGIKAIMNRFEYLDEKK